MNFKSIFKIIFSAFFLVFFSFSASPQSLTPEQDQAMEIVLNKLNQLESAYFGGEQSQEPPVLEPSSFTKMYKTGEFFFSKVSFNKDNLWRPNTKSWMWNQSSPKISWLLQTCGKNIFQIKAQKMNPRKFKNAPKAPSYKIWVYLIEKPGAGQAFYALWCEKGEASKLTSAGPVESGLERMNKTKDDTAEIIDKEEDLSFILPPIQESCGVLLNATRQSEFCPSYQPLGGLRP